MNFAFRSNFLPKPRDAVNFASTCSGTFKMLVGVPEYVVHWEVNGNNNSCTVKFRDLPKGRVSWYKDEQLWNDWVIHYDGDWSRPWPHLKFWSFEFALSAISYKWSNQRVRTYELDPKYNPLDQKIITRQGWTKTTRINQDYHFIRLGHPRYERLPKMHANIVR
jgi:hypothetical protein